MPEIIIVPAVMAAFCFVIWTFVDASRQKHRLKLMAEFNSRLVDRLGSVNDFSQFAKSEVGIRFLNSIVSDTPKPRPGDRILRATHIGIVLVALASGLLALARYFGDAEEFMIVGVVSMSLGGGFLISALVSHRVSVALGLNTEPPRQPLSETANAA